MAEEAKPAAAAAVAAPAAAPAPAKWNAAKIIGIVVSLLLLFAAVYVIAMAWKKGTSAGAAQS